jgi:hypothetical protein
MGTKELKWCTVRKNYFVLGRLEQPRQNKNLLYRQDRPSEASKEGPLSFVLFESPFASVSTVSQGPPLSIVSLMLILLIMLATSLPDRLSNNQYVYPSTIHTKLG